MCLLVYWPRLKKDPFHETDRIRSGNPRPAVWHGRCPNDYLGEWWSADSRSQNRDLGHPTTNTGAPAKLLPYQDAQLPAEQRITDLLQRMTIEEKLAMLGTDPTVPRLGIVGTNHVEGLHGLALGGPGGWGGRGLVTPTTQFPQSRGLGQTWDPDLLRQAAAEEAYETRWAYNKFHKGGLVVRAPNADLSRDPRWGRSEESYGEDPFLVGTLATAFSEGCRATTRRHG